MFASSEFIFSKWFAIRWKCNKLLFSFLRCISPNFAAEICRLLCTFVILPHLHICWKVEVVENIFLKHMIISSNIWFPSGQSSETILLVTMTLDSVRLWQRKVLNGAKMISRQRILNKLHSSLVALSWRFLFFSS